MSGEALTLIQSGSLSGAPSSLTVEDWGAEAPKAMPKVPTKAVAIGY